MSDPSLRSGELRHRITLQTMTEELDAVGQEIKTWSDAGDYWASIRGLSGRELIYARSIRDTVSHSITMRYQPGNSISPQDRILFGTRVFNIESVLNVDERNYRLDLLCTEVVTPGA